MYLLISMLPVYVLGNLHCLGMCGPLVMMIGQHRYRYFYFLGRLASFTLAGTVAGEMGAVLNAMLRMYHVPAAASFLFGGMILVIGVSTFFRWNYPGHQWLAKRMAKFNHTLSLLMLKDSALPTFLFGFFTIVLPCGQTLLVFSACALAGDAWTGFINGMAFALLTSPSLFLAMNAHRALSRFKQYYNTVVGVCALGIGFIALCRGFAELDLIPHLILSADYHIVIF